jgi:hypothetical protein
MDQIEKGARDNQKEKKETKKSRAPPPLEGGHPLEVVEPPTPPDRSTTPIPETTDTTCSG